MEVGDPDSMQQSELTAALPLDSATPKRCGLRLPFNLPFSTYSNRKKLSCHARESPCVDTRGHPNPASPTTGLAYIN